MDDCPVDNLTTHMNISESIQNMKEIECGRCGWNWIRLVEDTEANCPFCPEDLWGFVFIAP
jgi:hypothetical protein